MSAELFFQALEAIAVIAALGFAVVQVRQYRHDKRREAAFLMLQSFQTPTFARAMNIVYRLPDGLNKDEIENAVGDELHLVYALTTTWESLGILVFHREVELDLIDDFFSGVILISWQKIGRLMIGEREETGRETVGEWFEWLKDRLEEAESETPPVPAHIAHRDWKPK